MTATPPTDREMQAVVAIEMTERESAPAPGQLADGRAAPLLQVASPPDASSAGPSRMAALFGRERIRCQVCFERVAVEQSFKLTNCGHRFCKECLVMFLEVKIVEGQVYPLCFYDLDEIKTDNGVPGAKPNSCGASISAVDIETLVSDEIRTKYNLFKFNKENGLGRQCPYCGQSQVCVGPSNPACVCVYCHRSFCFLHANAHEGQSCASYEKQEVINEKHSRSVIQRISKPCPTCQTKIEKDGGCNHLKCSWCATNFCWLCGAIVDDADLPDHFQWWNLRGCAGLLRVDISQEHIVTRFASRFISFVHVFIVGPIAFVLALVLALLSCCCSPCVFMCDMKFVEAFVLGMELCSWLLLLPCELIVVLYTSSKRLVHRIAQRCARPSTNEPQPESEMV